MTVDEVQETSAVLEREREQSGHEDRCWDTQMSGQVDQVCTHHLEVSVDDVAEGAADVRAEPLSRPALALPPGRQAAQSLR